METGCVEMEADLGEIIRGWQAVDGFAGGA